ncbi:HD domain-containing phosphohydrolase [Helicobacter sp. MIT 14-3879]|uniref:HD domain-containing phosphohydrolase n=1 Tax=Helicobacter sp. MIT 14-3879 TaxID=2040649 RepID=UPI0011C0428F|nr:HD domain-containing phosphohydrolase [Helicobacter sp. MIT 14-3879]
MKTLSFTYNSDNLAKLKDLKQETSILIQIFCGVTDKEVANNVIKKITSILPQAEIILTSSFGAIFDGEIVKNDIVICVSTFKETIVRSISFDNSNKQDINKEIIESFIKDNTKLLIIFNDYLNSNYQNMLSQIYKKYPNLSITGGNSSITDNNSSHLSYKNTFVGDKSGVNGKILSIAALDSSSLQVNSDYIFEWSGIGIELIVTQSQGCVVKSINNIPTIEIYRKYLGEYVANNLPNSGMQFPITFKVKNLSIARVPKNVLPDGSIVYSGEVKEGTKVRFSTCSPNSVKQRVDLISTKLIKQDIDSIFLYDCAGRYQYFQKSLLDYKLITLNNIAPTAGHFTYGEFYHNNHGNHIFNLSNTFITLKESITEEQINTKRDIKIVDELKEDSPFNIMINLAQAINLDYIQAMHLANQYKEFLDKFAYIIYMNYSKNIIKVNDRFLDITQYSENEIIGKNYKELFILDDIENDDVKYSMENNNSWRGKLKILIKDNDILYAKSVILPITNHNKAIIAYMVAMDDITDTTMEVRKLHENLNMLHRDNMDKDFIISEYEDLINKTSPTIKTKKEIFIDVNDACVDVFKYKKDEILGRHISFLLGDQNQIEQIKRNLAQTGFARQMITCKNRLGKTLYLQASFMVIKNIYGNTDEVIGVLNSLTDYYESQKELENIQKEVIFTMGQIGEGRSQETGNHVRRVAEYSYLLASLYGLQERDAKLLKIVSPMHDIGKLAIPDSILHKPGKLDNNEFEVMKTHAQKGFEMLNVSNQLVIKTAAEVALTHHEWWNGNGYPNKLKGEDIPLYGRITAVADVFDALSHDRCYKKAWGIDEVVNHMIKNRDVQFDGKIVDLLVNNLNDFLNISLKFKDNF